MSNANQRQGEAQWVGVQRAVQAAQEYWGVLAERVAPAEPEARAELAAPEAQGGLAAREVQAVLE